jgi:glucose dehydrogenase
MNPPPLIHVGIKGSVVALDRKTGAIVWATPLKGSDFVNLLVEGDRIYATTYGEIFCLDARTGERQWHNLLKGYGRGLATMALEDGLRAGVAAALAEKRRRDEQAAAAVVACA